MYPRAPVVRLVIFLIVLLLFFLQMKDQRHGLNDVFRIHCHKNHIGERELKNIVNTMLSLALLSSKSSPRRCCMGYHHCEPFQQRKKPQSGNKMWNENISFFRKKSHKTLHKNYTNTSWKSKHSSLLVMFVLSCFYSKSCRLAVLPSVPSAMLSQLVCCEEITEG